MPYLTLWDKISQNLAHLEANSRKIFQISQNFQTILWRNKHKSHLGHHFLLENFQNVGVGGSK